MKKIHTYIIPALAALLALSCQQEMHDPASASGEEVTVSFTVNIPEAMQSKALGPGYGEEINCLAIELYTDADCKTLYTSKTIVGNPGEKWRNIQMTLFKDRTYYMLLVASASDSQVKPAEGTAFRNGIKLNYASVTDAASADMNGNDDKKDFFYAFKKVTTAELTQQIELQRPVAQINFITTDHAAITDLEDFIVGTTEITVKGVSDTFNPITGKAGETADVTFKASSIMETDEDASKQWLTMDYIIPALSGKNTVDIDATFRYTYKGIPTEATYNLRDVPVESKYRTNISGNIFTGEADLTFTLAPISSTEHNTEVWDGTTTDPVVPETSDPNTYIITTAEQLAWFRDMVNGNVEASASTASVKSGTNLPAETFEGKTVRLGADIDLAGQEWEPIGVNTPGFCGTFDGAGYTIRSFKVSTELEGNRAGLFGSLGDPHNPTHVTIKDLTISNANILYPENYTGDYYAAALAAYGAWGTQLTLKNVKVTNSLVEGNNKVGGLLAHDNGYYSLLIEDCVVENSEIRTGNNDDGGAVGGLIGYYDGVELYENQPASHVIKNSVVRNCTIKAVNSKDGTASAGNRSNGEFIGCVLLQAQQVITIEGCKIENNTFTQTRSDGVTPVTYVSPFGVWVGGQRTESVPGKIIVDGLEAVADGVGLNAAGEYIVSSANGLKWLSSTVSSGTTFAGKTIKLSSDIDLNNEEWTPIGTSECTFDGIFDGNGHTISNLKINKQNGCIALFAYATNEIKNLEIHNADVYGYGTNVSVVAAHDNYKSLTMSNIKLTGLIKVEGVQNVASVMGYNYGSLSDIVVDVDEGSYVKSTSTDSGADNHVGGVIGYLAEGSGGMKNVKSNIDVIATKGYGIVGGLVGLLQYNNKLEYCSCSGDVTLIDVRAGSENRPYRIGGIAGTWESSTGTTELSGCSYSGSLKSTSTIEFDYNGLVGRAWNTTHTGGKLIVDGDDWTTFGAEYDEDTQTYNVYNIQGLRYVCETFTNQSIVKVKLTEDIILNEDAVFDPIARSVSLDFSLELDGNGKTISNLKFDSEGKDQGLFSELGGTVKNLHFKNVTGTAAGRLAALAGKFCGKIEECTIDGISLSVTEDRVGAFVGLSYGTTISGCKVTNAAISAVEGHAGGLVGTISGGASDTYIGNTIEGTITSIGYTDSVHALYGGLADNTSVFVDNGGNVTTGVTLVTAE